MLIRNFKNNLPVLGAYPLYNCEETLSWTASITSLAGFKFPKVVGSPANVFNFNCEFWSISESELVILLRNNYE